MPGNHFLLRGSTICLSISMTVKNTLFLLIGETKKNVVNSGRYMIYACKSNLDLWC